MNGRWERVDGNIYKIDKKVDRLGDKFDNYLMQALVKNSSPLNLTDMGRKMFAREAIQEFVSKKFADIIAKMQEHKFETAYQAQESLLSVVDGFKEDATYKTILENEAFQTGQHIDILMKVIAIGLRDRVFESLKLNVHDIDTSDPNNKSGTT